MQHVTPPTPPSTPDADPRGDGGRLNLLLGHGGDFESSAVEQLVRLLEPMGIRAIEVRSGEQAADVLHHRPIHVAVVDWSVPLRAGATDPAGGRVLQLLQRADPVPPTVVVRPRQASTRDADRGLSEALRCGAFAVVDRPLDLEVLLEVLRRILRRHYAGGWPA